MGCRSHAQRSRLVELGRRPLSDSVCIAREVEKIRIVVTATLEELSGTTKLTEWTPSGRVPAGFAARAVILGRDEGQLALEVVVLGASPSASMSREALGALHASRLGRRVTPVVVAAERDGQTWLFGPNAQAAAVGPLPTDQAQRMLQSALDEPSGIAARHRLAAIYSAIEGTQPSAGGDHLPGIANGGLFATHELRYGVRQRPDWSSACETAGALLPLRRDALIEALGYTAQQAAAHALILTVEGVVPRAVAVLLDEEESFDGDSHRFSVSPVAYAVSIAQKHELPWVLVLRGSQLRLYPARAELGVGRKGLAETYFEVDLALVTEETAGYLSLVFSATALGDGGTTAEILASSAQYAVALGERLRFQVYDQIVPRLSLAIAAQLPALGHELDRTGLDLAYRLTLRVFFRLLFQAYAEDRKLLPFGENPRYDRNALNTLAHDLVEHPDETFDPESTTLWDDLTQVWRVIDKGDKAWSVPPYNGGLFGSDPELAPEGALLERIGVANDVMGPVLRAMLVDTDPENVTGAIDFRSLSVREFGSIYEGLLESNLAVADTDLVLDDKDTWVPAGEGESLDPERSAPRGSVYFHNTSGQRKGTGSYFTPSFVVEHLLEGALDPTLDEHLARVKKLLDEGDQAGAADLFFDFRVADLAMGSGHFLTAAIDHLETAMAAFLADNPIPGVTNELRHLETAARDAAGPDAPDPEPSSLLRRQIARRCVYGLDINPIAVELARVSIWIHTFVRGLPMSSLDHALVCADSLTGVATVAEAVEALDPTSSTGQMSIFGPAITETLEDAKVLLADAAAASEATKAQALQSTEAAIAARQAALPAKLLFDAVVAARLGLLHPNLLADPEQLRSSAAESETAAAVHAAAPAYFPYHFPEVFLRDNPGFDVVVGNPPWEKLKVEEHSWWNLRFPGLQRGASQTEKNALIAQYRRERPDLTAEFEATQDRVRATAALVSAGPFHGIGATDIDLMAAFAWRYAHTVRSLGSIGVVLPRTAFAGSAGEQWRRHLLASGDIVDLTVLLNAKHWVFEAVHPQMAISLLAFRAGGSTPHTVTLRGPFASLQEFASAANREPPVATFSVTDVERWSGTAAFPLLPDAASLPVFALMRTHPDLGTADGEWTFRPLTELHTTKDKKFYDFNLDDPDPSHTLAVWTGRTFNLWGPEVGTPYAWADPEVVVPFLDERRRSQSRVRSSAFSEMSIEWLGDSRTLPVKHPRIVFRDVTKWDNARTMLCVLAPPDVTLVHKAPYLLKMVGDASDEAYLLAVLSSIPFDWYARRFVELTMSYSLLNSFPVPRPIRTDRRRVRVVEISGRLAAVDDRFDEWAAALDVPVASVTDASTKDDMIAELDALVASLYGLSSEQVEHVFATFHRGWDYGPRLEKVLGFFDALDATE